MKALVLKGGKILLEEYPVPEPGPREVVIKNLFSAVSTGTERTAVKTGTGGPLQKVLKHPELVQKFIDKMRTEGIRPAVKKAIEKLKASTGDALPLGYSCAGEVVKVGEEVADLSPGTLVAAGGAGYASHAEFVRVPRNLVVRVPEGVSPKEACFATIGAIAVHGLRRAELKGGDTVVIYGLGLLGLIALQVAKAWGLKVIGIDIDEAKIKKALELGADLACQPGEKAVEETKKLTGGFGADASVIYASTPSSEPVNESFKLLRHKGRVVIVGDVGINISRSLMYHGEHDVVIATSYGPGRYDPVYEEMSIDYPIGYVKWTENRNMEHFLQLLREKKVKIEPLITAEYPFNSAPQALEEIKTSPQIGVVFEYGASEPARSVIPVGKKPEGVKGRICMAFVGPGEFARVQHLPSLKKREKFFRLKHLIARNPVKAGDIARQFGFENAGTSLEDALRDPEIDLVFISTPHSQHAEQVIKSLESGKVVFVEKPLCVTREELQRIEEVLRRTNGRVIVGFNRRYSPFARKAKQLIKWAGEPCHILYRVNAGYLPPDHWVHRPEEGGRLVGEGCHFFNFFVYLTGSAPRNVFSAGVKPDGARYVEVDSFSIIAEMEDGSTCSLFYTARGSRSLPKEYVEVHAGGVTLVIHDYRELKIYTDRKDLPADLKSFSLSGQNKGLEEELDEIARFMLGEEHSLISHEEIFRSMDFTFRAREALLTAQG